MVALKGSKANSQWINKSGKRDPFKDDIGIKSVQKVCSSPDDRVASYIFYPYSIVETEFKWIAVGILVKLRITGKNISIQAVYAVLKKHGCLSL